MSKKGELSINMIVIAAIAMIILVVVSVLIFRSGGILDESRTCSAVNGECVERYFNSCQDYANSNYLDGTWTRHATANCPEPSEEMCCVKLGGR